MWHSEGVSAMHGKYSRRAMGRSMRAAGVTLLLVAGCSSEPRDTARAPVDNGRHQSSQSADADAPLILSEETADSVRARDREPLAISPPSGDAPAPPAPTPSRVTFDGSPGPPPSAPPSSDFSGAEYYDSTPAPAATADAAAPGRPFDGGADGSRAHKSGSEPAYAAAPSPPEELGAPAAPERRFERQFDASIDFAHATAVDSDAIEGPSGAYRESKEYVVVPVFYGTDRAADPIPWSEYQLVGERRLVLAGAVFFVSALCWGGFMFLRQRRGAAVASLLGALAWAAIVAVVWGRGGVTVVKEGVAYTGDRGQLVRGLAEVTIPQSHQRGELEAPQLWKLEIREDARRHVVLRRTRELLPKTFAQQVQAAVAASPDRDVLVFVHGYNVGFADAVRRTAQIAYDLPFEGVPVCYSWPSQASLAGYTIDENNVAWSTSHLRDFLLELVAVSGADSINLVAHSMGNRALTGALKEISYARQGDSEPFDRVVLAAPDVDADLFRKDLAASLLHVSRSVTLYASSGDMALAASKRVHGYPRAGESGESIVVIEGVDTVDVSGIDLSLLGHGYYAASHPILRDLFGLIRQARPARERDGLRRIDSGPLTYWQLAAPIADAVGDGLRR